MATSASQTLIRNLLNDLSSPPSPAGLTPTIVSAKSKRRRHRHRRRERERALQASSLAALPEHPPPSDREEDNKLSNPNAIANPASPLRPQPLEAAVADAKSDDDQNTRDDDPNSHPDINIINDDKNSDNKASGGRITGIGLQPVEKSFAVICEQRHPGPTTRSKRARATPSTCSTGKVSVQAAAKVRDPDPVVAAQPCVRCVENMFVLDKSTGKVVGPAACVLKRRSPPSFTCHKNLLHYSSSPSISAHYDTS
ncbi:hypothetical protein BDW72DRAFT_194774 [Aspergillus terricola var. indicus]